MPDSSNRHGGARKGAGRKPSLAGPSRVMRVPANQAEAVRAFLARGTILTEVAAIMPLAIGISGAKLPLYVNKVAAGFPSPADDYVERRLSPGEYLIDNDDTTFFVRVKGDSMIDAGIFENDVLVVDRACTPQPGDIVLAVLDGEFTVKQLGRDRDKPQLIPANLAYPVIDIKPDQSFEVWGVVTGSMRKFK